MNPIRNPASQDRAARRLLVALWLLLIPSVHLITACRDIEDAAEDDGGSADQGLWPPDQGGFIAEACEPNEVRCADLEHRMVCNSDGYGWILRRCVSEEGIQQSCVDGSCLDRVCPEPGTFVACVDAKSQRRCNGQGTGWEEVVCENGTCVEGQGCQEQVCRPGKRRCQSDELLEECNAEGSRWISVQNCKDGSRVCQENVGPTGAACVELCEVVRKERNYYGCEYWAVDLDNAFVPGGDTASGYYDAQGKQFAAVISNVSTQLEARITVDIYEGRLFCAPWEDIPQIENGAFTYEPDGVWCQPSYDRCMIQQRCTTVTERYENGRTFSRDVCTDVGRMECVEEMYVGPNQLLILNLHRMDLNGTTLAKRAFRIQSSVPINAYQFNPLDNVGVFSNDASLLLPISVLGKNYLVMTREQTFDILRGYLTVVAVWPGLTEVYVTPTTRTLPGFNIPALQPGQRKSFTLEQFDVLNIETNCPTDDRGYCRTADDLTGSEVFSDKPIAVFGGSEAADAPNTNHCSPHAEGELGTCWDGETPCEDHSDCSDFIICCADHLEKQMMPLETWGRRYIATKTYNRGLEPDVWRIMAQKDGTRVETTPHQADIPVLNRAEWFEFVSTEHFELEASSAVMVGQFLAGEQAPDPNVRGRPGAGDAGIGDPSFILAVPVEQYMNRYVVLAPDKYEEDYVSITAPMGSSVLLDGVAIPPGRWEVVADGDFVVARLPIQDGVHIIESVPEPGAISGPPIGVLVYGWDQYVSYGYPGGLSLHLINTCRLDSDCPRDAICVEGECQKR